MPDRPIRIALVAFDDFADADLFLPWDILNRVEWPGWSVRILGKGKAVTSTTGLSIPVHGGLAKTATADAVLVTGGPGTGRRHRDRAFLDSLKLNPERQLIGSICSGALILAAKGLLAGKRATTYPTTKGQLEGYGVEVVEDYLVVEGQIATAAGCLAATQLCGWMIERLTNRATRDAVIASVQPVGQGLSFAPESHAA